MQNNPSDPHYKTKDKLHQVRLFIDTLNRLADAMCEPGKKWSINESINPYLGSFCPIKVYMKDKPHKFVIKVWDLKMNHLQLCILYDVKNSPSSSHQKIGGC